MRRSIHKFKNSLNIIIDDLRFQNEFAMLREEGAKIVGLQILAARLSRAALKQNLRDINSITSL